MNRRLTTALRLALFWISIVGFQGTTIVRSVKVLRDTQYRVLEYSSLFEKKQMAGLDIKEYLDLLNSVSLENIYVSTITKKPREKN